MDGLVDVQHGADHNAIYRDVQAPLLTCHATRRARGIPRSALHNGGMENGIPIDVAAACERVFNARKDKLRTKTEWARKAGLTESTARTAFAGRNTTVATLAALAEAAGMTLPEMLEYGQPDWEVKVRVRALVRQMSDDQLQALENLLVSRLKGSAQ